MLDKIKFIVCLMIFLNSCSEKRTGSLSLYSFLPTDSEIIININDLNNTKEILNKNKLLENIIFEKDLIINQINSLSSRYSDKEGLLTLSSFGNNDIAFTYIRKLNPEDSIKDSDSIVNQYQKYKIFLDKTNNIETYKTILKEFIISSNKDIVLENIIRDFNSSYNNVEDDLLKVSNTIDTDEPFNIISKSINSDIIKNKLEDISFFPKSNTSWIAYDFNYSTENFFLSGITRINDSINGNISILKNISPTQIKNDLIIPNSFLSYLSFTIRDSERFIFNYKNYLKLNDLSSDNLDFESLNLINEITFVEDQEKFIILGINNVELLENYFELEQYDLIDNIKTINVDKELLIVINNVDKEIIPNYAVLIGNSLVVTNSLSQIKKIINSQKINDNLKLNKNYLNFKNKKSINQSFIWVVNNKKINEVDSKVYPFLSISGKVNQDIALLELDFSILDNLGNNKEIFTEFFQTYDNKIISDPKWIKNHLNNEFDFIFQDNENYLYYFSNNGNLNWKKKLTGRVLGEIKQVDIFKNGRLQMAFRTKDRLYVLDRNGNEVDKLSFNINSSDVKSSLSIFDYDKNRDYRFLLTDNDNMIMYDSNGKIVSGFKPESFNSKISNNPVHIRIDGKDYIVIQLENDILKILDRRGRDRLIVNKKIKFSENQIYSYMKNFATTDRDGNLIMINQDGEIDIENLNLTANNKIDIDYDNLVYTSENNLSIKGISIKLPYGNFSKPKIFNVLKKTFIGITDLSENKIYIYNNNGKLSDGFPLSGNSIIDVKDSDNDNKIEIITRLDDYSIVIYEIN